MDGRHTWSRHDEFLLRWTYQNRDRHGIEYPEALLHKFGKNACYTKAYRMGITSQTTPRRLGMETWLDTEVAYLAGIIDGEGCIYDGTGNTYGSWVVTINTTDKMLFDWLKKLDRGGSYTQKRGAKEHHKRIYVFRVAAMNDVLEILEYTEPYMIVKKERASEAITWLKNKLN